MVLPMDTRYLLSQFQYERSVITYIAVMGIDDIVAQKTQIPILKIILAICGFSLYLPGAPGAAIKGAC